MSDCKECDGRGYYQGDCLGPYCCSECNGKGKNQMATKLDELKAAKKEIETLKKDVKKRVKTIFHEASKELFKENPNLKSISWAAYTPYFNDGDTCTFSSGHDYCDINGVGEYFYAEEWDKLDEKEQKKLHGVVKSFMKNWDDDDMLDLFGDHVKVTITAKGIKTEEYEHE